MKHPSLLVVPAPALPLSLPAVASAGLPRTHGSRIGTSRWAQPEVP